MKLKEKRGVEYNTVIYNIQWETENDDLPSEVQHDFFLENDENIEDEIYSFLMQLSNGVAPLGYQIEMNNEEYYYQPDEDYWEDEEVVNESVNTNGKMTISDFLDFADKWAVYEISKKGNKVYYLGNSDYETHSYRNYKSFLNACVYAVEERIFSELFDYGYVDLDKYTSYDENTDEQKPLSQIIKDLQGEYKDAVNDKGAVDNIIQYAYYVEHPEELEDDVELSESLNESLPANDLEEIGKDVASLYGGELLDYEELEDGSVRFHCIEDGEEFITDLTKEEIENYWDDDDDNIDDSGYLNLKRYLKDIENTLDKKYPGLDDYYDWAGIDDEYMLKFCAPTYNAENIKNTLNVIKTYFKKQNIPFATDVEVDRNQHIRIFVLVNADQFDDNFLRDFNYKWLPKKKEESLTEDNYHPLAKKLGAKLLPPKEKAKPRYTYEVYWYDNDKCDGDPIFKTFYSKKKAQEWYDAHCNDADKFCMDEPYGSRVDEAYSNKEIDRRVNQRQRYLNHLKQQENDVKIPWTVFTFEDGSNPYVVKTQKELDRMLKKYDDRLKQVGENAYKVLNKAEESIVESGNKKDSFVDIDGEKHYYTDYGVIKQNEYKNRTIVKDEDLDRYTIWSNKFCRPLSKFRDNNELEAIWFDTYDEVIKYIDKDSKDESLKEDTLQEFKYELSDDEIAKAKTIKVTRGEQRGYKCGTDWYYKDHLITRDDTNFGGPLQWYCEDLFGDKAFDSLIEIKYAIYQLEHKGESLEEARNYESDYNITPSDRRKIIQWWKDLAVYYEDIGSSNQVVGLDDLWDNEDGVNIDEWLDAMYDALIDLVEDKKDSTWALQLLRSGKLLYNKYAPYSKFNYGVKESNKQGCPTKKESPIKEFPTKAKVTRRD